MLAGVATIAIVLRLDKRHAPHLFPTSFPQLQHPVSLGLWILLLMPLAQAPVYVYGPYILQMYRGLSPTLAGYFGATHALAWSVTAILIARLHPRWQNASILSGPSLLTAGLAGLALTTATQPLGLVLASLVVVGVGFGVCNMFVNQRIMASVQKGQEDETAGPFPPCRAWAVPSVPHWPGWPATPSDWTAPSRRTSCSAPRWRCMAVVPCCRCWRWRWPGASCAHWHLRADPGAPKQAQRLCSRAMRAKTPRPVSPSARNKSIV